MLKALRHKKTAKRIWIILVTVIVPAFIFWGSGSLIRSKQEATYAGKIFGRKISLLEYKDALLAVRNQMTMQFGDKFTEVQKHLNLESLAWERLILLAEAKKRKIKVGDEEVIRLIKSYPFFQRKNQFNNTLYQEMIQYVFHTQPRIFEEQTRQNLILSKLFDTVTNTITLSDEEIKEAYRKENEQVSIYYIASVYSDFLKDITPSEEEIKDYFTQNSLQFRRPLSFNIEYVSLSSQDQDQRLTKDKIDKLTLRLKNKKEDFMKVASDFGLTVKETGLFGQTDPIPGIGWSQEILNLISKANPGEFLPSIHMDKYYYILRLKERKEPYIPDFETIKDKIKETFIKDKSQRVAKERIENCLKKLKEVYQTNPKEIDFDKWALEFGLKSASTDLFKYGSYIEGVGASDNFWMAAQKLKENEFSEIIDMGLAGFYIIKLKSRMPIDEEKFNKEKAAFSQKLLSQKKEEYFIKFLEELKKSASLL